MASTAPITLFCDRGKSMRKELATGSLVGPWAGVWAIASVEQITRETAKKVRFTEILLRDSAYNGTHRRMSACLKRVHHRSREQHNTWNSNSRVTIVECLPCQTSPDFSMEPRGKKTVPPI